MISGGSPVARPVRAVLWLLGAGIASTVAVGAAPAVSADWGIKRLMHDLAQVKSAKARYVERKYLGILNTLLESSGTLIYIAPSRLEKRTLAPRPESLVLEGSELTIEGGEGNRRRTLNLQDYPMIRAFVESIRSTLAGDLPTLTRFYQIELDGGERQWRLTLKPSEPEMQEVVSEIRISGEFASINAVETIETNGDRSVMTVVSEGP